MEHDLICYILTIVLLVLGYGGYAALEILEDKKHENSKDKL